MRRREKGRAVQFDYFLLASVAARSKLDLTTKRNKEREVEISKSREEKKVCEWERDKYIDRNRDGYRNRNMKERKREGRERFPQLDESTLQHDDGVTTITAFIYAAFT